VPADPFSRRSFLALAGGAAGAVFLAACGGDDSAKSAGTGATTGNLDALVSSVVSSDLYASPSPQRFAFILTTQRHVLASGAPASVSIKPPAGPAGPSRPATLHTEGLPAKRGVYTLTPQLTVAGIYRAVVTTGSKRLELPFQVQPRPQAPAVGTTAPLAASPTTTKPLGVHPLCTRKPECPLHAKSLSDVIGKGRPVAVMFATPALCQTRYCGPVLDTLLPFAKEFGDRIDFVHVEIYRDSSGTTVSPTVEAWGIPSEPWLFGIDKQGKIVARLDSAFATDEIRGVMNQLVA
jgi:hypothetical protein